MIAVATFYALITAAAMLIVSVAYRHERLSLGSVPAAALMLFATYGLSNAVMILSDLDSGMRMFMCMDAMCLVIAGMQWRVTRQPWAIALAVLFGFEVVRHAAYLAGSTGEYALFLNICYVAQLLCVALPAFSKLMGEPRSGRAAN